MRLLGAALLALVIGAATAPAAAGDLRWVGYNDDRSESTVTHDSAATLMRRSGANIARVTVHWGDVQFDSPARWNWAAPDQVMAALRRQGIAPLLVVYEAPIWSLTLTDQIACRLNEPDAGRNGCRYPPNTSVHREAFKTFIRALVLRYPEAVALEIWNEPNLKCFWGHDPSPAEYAQLLQPAYQAAKYARPDITVLTGGINGTQVTRTSSESCGGAEMHFSEYLHGLYHFGRGSFDAISVHAYPWHKSEHELASRVIEQTRQVKARFNDQARPIWIDETGASRTCAPICVGGSWSESEQAQWLMGTLQRLRHQPDVDMIGFHQLLDTTRPGINQGYGFLASAPGFPPHRVYCALSEALRSGHSCLGHSGSDTTPPETTITSATARIGGAAFSFAGSGEYDVFECRIDDRAWELCPPATVFRPDERREMAYTSLAPGTHVFAVRAFDLAGNADPTPATRAFAVP